VTRFVDEERADVATVEKDCDFVQKVDMEIHYDVCMTQATMDLEMARQNVIGVWLVMRNVSAMDCNAKIHNINKTTNIIQIIIFTDMVSK